MTHTLTVAAMLTLLVASYVLLAWIARHPQVFTATARDARDPPPLSRLGPGGSAGDSPTAGAGSSTRTATPGRAAPPPCPP